MGGLKRTGEVILPLHSGHAPRWLTVRMKRLSDEMVRLMAEEYGPQEFLRRLSDPYWFQAFGCLLGFDWHSSGLTTVVTGILKDVLRMERHGVVVAGGKGRASRGTQRELERLGEVLNVTGRRIEEFQYASRMCAKVDTAAIQAGYPIYHHTIFIDEEGGWAVVQQGMCEADRTARRYHWLASHVKSFVVEPHDAVVGDTIRPRVLNMTAREAEENRRACVDLVKGDPHTLISSLRRLTPHPSLDRWVEEASLPTSYHESYRMPRNLNWRLFKELYDHQPSGYEELLAFRGVGPATVRALALLAQLVYGSKVSWRDPVKFSFAHGGKDGVPFPVNRRAMDESVRFLREMLEASELLRREKRAALQRLGRLSRDWGLE